MHVTPGLQIQIETAHTSKERQQQRSHFVYMKRSFHAIIIYAVLSTQHPCNNKKRMESWPTSIGTQHSIRRAHNVRTGSNTEKTTWLQWVA